jgi:hypothetical protein
MSTIKFTASAEFTEEQILDFALAKGWGESTDLSATEYVSEIIKNKIIWIVGAPTREKIKQDFETQKKETLTQYEQELNNLIQITNE